MNRKWKVKLLSDTLQDFYVKIPLLQYPTMLCSLYHRQLFLTLRASAAFYDAFTDSVITQPPIFLKY